MAKREEFLCECPLMSLDAMARVAVPEAELQGGHPFIGAEADGAEALLELHGVGRLTRAGETADDDQPRRGPAHCLFCSTHQRTICSGRSGFKRFRSSRVSFWKSKLMAPSGC